MEEFIGKEVIIYPGDTHKKQGIVKSVSFAGVTFMITKYDKDDGQYVVGKLTFISYSARLTFREI